MRCIRCGGQVVTHQKNAPFPFDLCQKCGFVVHHGLNVTLGGRKGFPLLHDSAWLSVGLKERSGIIRP